MKTSSYNSKLPNVGTTIFTVMSQMAKEFNAINLSQGFPNFPVEDELVELVQKTAESDCYQYAPMSGNPVLLNKISTIVESQYSRRVNPENELLITAGATQAIFTAIQALVYPGEEVIILDPCYDCYESPIILTGATPVHVRLNDNFTVDWNMVEEAISSKTKMLIVNNPHNPSGRIFQQQDILALENLVQKYPELILLSDEVYEFITFEQKHLSINSSAILRERSVIVSSFGKTLHITGWKIGYCIAPKELMTELKKVHQFLVFSVNSLGQAVLATYLDKINVETLGLFYLQKRNLFRELLSESRFDLLPCEGTYFQTAGYKRISMQKDTEFVKALVQQHGVAAIPISVFNANNDDQHVIRFCFAKTDETLIQAADKLCKI